MKTYEFYALLPSNNDFEKFYQNELNKFYYFNSATVTDANGNPVGVGVENKNNDPFIEVMNRYFYYMPNSPGGEKTTVFIPDKKTKDGNDLTEKMFIEESLFKIETNFIELKFELSLDTQIKAEKYIDFLKKRLIVCNNIVGKTDTQQLQLSENVLNWLRVAKCTNGKTYIENTPTTPLKWLQNKQLARELLTHDKIKGSLSVAEIERQTPTLFIDENNNPLTLAKNRKIPSTDSDNLSNYLATL